MVRFFVVSFFAGINLPKFKFQIRYGCCIFMVNYFFQW
jgi:hypothetical protein